MAAIAIPAAIGLLGAMMNRDSGGGSPGYAGFMQSPEQRQLMQLSLPLAQKAMQFGLGNIGYTPGTTGTGYAPTVESSQYPWKSMGRKDFYMRDPFLGGEWLDAGQPNQLRFALDPIAPGAATPMAMMAARTNLGASPYGGMTMGGGTGGAGGGNIESLWPIPSYGIPSPEMMMPTAATMGSISPDVWSGIMQPYQRVEQQLMETLGAGGGLGSARGGFSGQGAAGLGKYWAESAPGIGMQAWNMISPALQQGWGAQLQRGQNLWAEQMQQYKYPWQAGPSFLSMGMPFPYVQQPGQPSPSPMAGMGSLFSGIAQMYGSGIFGGG